MQKIVHIIGFWEKRQFFRRKFQKSQKIVIITSTPEKYQFRRLSDRTMAKHFPLFALILASA
jgi:hypothetical protein